MNPIIPPCSSYTAQTIKPKHRRRPNIKAMLSVCALPIMFAAPAAFARLAGEPDVLHTNTVSSTMKLKRIESQASMKPIQFAVDVNISASAIQEKLSADLLVKSVYYHNSITSMPTKAMLNSAIQATANEMVNCEITCEVTDKLLARIADLGGRVVSSSRRFGSVHAFLPLVALEILSEEEAVKRIREAHKPMLNKMNTSEGAVSHRAASARSMYGVSGTGIKIGVISDSVRYLDQIQSSGDLPSNVTVLPGLSGILDDESDTGEGTAMLEIVHDLCPGAALYFATAGETEAEMAESIIALKNAGCDIIVDDLCFRSESAFQDGIIASAVKDVYDSGKIFVTCAANKGNYDSGYSGVWEGDFNPSPETVTLGGVEYEQHVFPDESTGNLLNYWSAYNVYTLQWSDPLGASGNDYELAVYDYDTGTWLQKSGDVQNGDDDPYDWCSITPNMATYKGLGLRILKKKGAANRFIRVAAFNQPSQSGGSGRLEMSTAGMVYGHNASPYAISVAATDYVSNRAFTSSDKIAYYSSDGPRKMFYDITGTSYTTSKLASGGRSFNKPDFAAASSVSCATPDFETFGGTSAAAPHIAAICGLMLHANRDLTQAEVLNMLRSAVVSPYSGWNRTYGYGMVNAEECVRLAKESASGASSDLEINIASGTTSGSCTVENDGSSWKIVESFPSWVKGITFYCAANGNLMSLANNGTSIGFSGEASMTVNCTTNDTGAARTWDLSISNRTTRAIQYRIHVTQKPHATVSPPDTPSLTGITTYGSNARTDYIQVGWTVAARATSYNVYRNTSNSTSGRTKIATNATSPYKDYVSKGLVPGVKYWYWVEAVNTAGSTFSGSDWGNILVSASLSKTALGFTAAGGTSNITVTANTSWSATKSDSWLSLSSSGTSGNGSIAVTAEPNTTTAVRTGRIIVTAGAGTSYPKTVTNTVTQSANASAGTYAIEFNRMDYSGTTLTYTFDVGIAQPLPRLWADMGWSYSEHEFLGWATNTYSSAQGQVGEVVYADGASVKDLAAKGKTAFLYAVWTTTSTVNDDFANATRISGRSGAIRGSTRGATSQSGEPLILYSTSATNTIWWTWTAPVGGSATFCTTNTAFDTVMGIYTGTSVSSLTTICQDDDGGPNRTSICSFTATQGQTYYIAVSGYGNSNQGTVRLDWSLVETSQIADLPDICPYTPAGWSGSLVLSTESQNATNSTATSFSPNDAIYVSLSAINLGVGFSNDFNWALYVDDSLRTTGANWGSGLAANGYSRWVVLPIGPLSSGEHTIKVVYDYTGRIAESNESNNTVARTVIVSGTVVRPSNDNFARATIISGMSGSVTGSNVNATCESGEPLPNISAGATNTIWWAWTAPVTGIAQFSTDGSKVRYTAMGAYVGSSVSDLTTIAASANSYSQSSISFSVAAGTRYYIAVSGTDYRCQGTVKLTWSIFIPVPLNTALDNASLSFTTGGAANWVGVSDESYYGGSSARSGIITDSQSTWMQTEVAGEGTLSFWYKVSSESVWDKLIFYVDGVQKMMASGTVGWTHFECVVSNNTQHVFKWTYSKDISGSSGSDCCWIDEVAFLGSEVDATSTTPEPVPYSWLDVCAATLLSAHGGDYEAAANATAANGVNKVWECYVTGIDPEDEAARFEATIEMDADGKPVVKWNPPLTEEEAAKRTYRTLGKKTLDPNEEWTDVTDEADLDAAGYRFFKVKVEMK